jgi:O-antigen/teichoic acid export membrane protein
MIESRLANSVLLFSMKPENATPHRIGSRTTAGASILIVLRLTTRCIDLAALVILGRLLSPADFGIVAIAMSVIMIVEAVMELPVAFALVAFPTRTKAHYDTAFTLQLTKGILLATILLILAWPLSYVYHDHRLMGLICALSAAPASRGLGSPRLVERSMKFDFRPNFVMEVAGKLVALAFSVALAWKTGSYWSLAVGTIVAPITMATFSYFYAPYLPAITIKEWREFAAYLGWTTAGQPVSALNWQIDQLLLGRFVSRFDLGHFSMAANLAALPIQIFVVQVINPLLVAFSLVREDKSRLQAAYHKSAITIVAIGLPIMAGMSINAEPIVRLILGNQWLEAAWILRWLSLATIPSLFASPLTPLSVTLNRTVIFFRLSVTEFVFKLPLMIVGTLYYGIPGVLAARVATALVVAGYSMFAVRGLIKLPVRAQLLGPWRSILSAVIMAIMIAPLEGWLSARQGVLQLSVGLFAVTGVGAMIYTTSMFLLWWLVGYPDGLETHAARALAHYSRKTFGRFAA